MKKTENGFQEIGGGRFGKSSWWCINYSWPFVQLKVDEDAIAISHLFKTFRISFKDLIEIQTYNGLFSEGIRFVHSNPLIPPFIVFWTVNREKWVEYFSKQSLRINRSGQ